MIVSTAHGAPSRSMIRSGGSGPPSSAQISSSAARGVAARASPEQATRRTSGSGSPSSGTICSTAAGMPGRVSRSAARARVVGRRELSFALRSGSSLDASMAPPIASIRAAERAGYTASIDIARSTCAPTP